eukprot:CAMPEP_0167781280 /NCGR_PEP_ID=MMETSP0111_2-20121227/5846_1 /TAXON_ID=91324 /ORGANISM="Lotharella globosa, Strain CCCM811" /LENGTH=326 /DNA_ID=CAMNT_0007671927 /DNA_START=12 /DNA_END=989 /DNA_ORIENTATION=+
MAMLDTEANLKFSAENYTPVEVTDAKNQIRVLYMRHGESVANFFKDQTKVPDMTALRVKALLLKEMRKMEKILVKKDIEAIEGIKCDEKSNLKDIVAKIEDKLRDVVLSEKGVFDAAVLRQKFFGLYSDEDPFRILKGQYPINHVVVSPLRRTQETFMAVFSEFLIENCPKISVECNPYFHEWVKRDTGSSRCTSPDVSAKFPGFYAKHGKELEGCKSCCCWRRKPKSNYAEIHRSMENSLKMLKPGWSDKGNELAKEYAYFNGKESFATFAEKQIVPIKKRLDELVQEGKTGVLVVAHGMLGRVLFKHFLGDYDMKNYATIETVW